MSGQPSNDPQGLDAFMRGEPQPLVGFFGHERLALPRCECHQCTAMRFYGDLQTAQMAGVSGAFSATIHIPEA